MKTYTKRQRLNYGYHHARFTLTTINGLLKRLEARHERGAVAPGPSDIDWQIRDISHKVRMSVDEGLATLSACAKLAGLNVKGFVQ